MMRVAVIVCVWVVGLSMARNVTHEFGAFKSIDDTEVSTNSKPVLYVNNPQLLKEMQEQTVLEKSFRLSAPSDDSQKKEADLETESGSVSGKNHISFQLRKITDELGVTKLQSIFDELSYANLELKERASVEELVKITENKLSRYGNIVSNVSEIILSDYRWRFQQMEEEIFPLSYLPCCLMMDHILRYNSQFSLRINDDRWCDSGFGVESGDLPPGFFPHSENTSVFLRNNMQKHVTLKWQYFMSPFGLHREFPAYRPGNGVGSDCDLTSRHRHVFETTVRPDGRNLVVSFDLGDSVTPRQLLLAKTFGHHIIGTLSKRDNVAFLGLAGGSYFPPIGCIKHGLVMANHETRHNLRQFIDYMEVQRAPTNHTAGLLSIMQLVRQWTNEHPDSTVVVLYISPGKVMSMGDANEAFYALINQLETFGKQVVFNTYALGMPEKTYPWSYVFLESLALREYWRYNMTKPLHTTSQGSFINIPSSRILPEVVRGIYNGGDLIKGGIRRAKDEAVTISEPFWDDFGQGTVVAISKAIWDGPELVGVAGVDVPLADLLEEIVHLALPQNMHLFVADQEGHMLCHPKLGHPETWISPPVPIQVTQLEGHGDFRAVWGAMTSLTSGHWVVEGIGADTHYWWGHCPSTGWIVSLVAVVNSSPLTRHHQLSRHIAPSSSILFHRLDLFSSVTEGTRICRLFHQMATMDGTSVYLSPGSYSSPLHHLMGGSESGDSVGGISAYLSDATGLIANPGLRNGVKSEVAVVYGLDAMWQSGSDNEIGKCIVRRYAGTPLGVMVMYPGTVTDRTFDPRTQPWFLNAVKYPGLVVVSPPFLDPGGAGHVVSISKAVLQGTKLTSINTVPTAAVVGVDVNVGFMQRMMMDAEPLCGMMSENNTAGTTIGIRCILSDIDGYLIYHPFYNGPAVTSFDLPRHLTHLEPLLAKELLNDGVMVKRTCTRWSHGTVERHFVLIVPSVSSEEGSGISEMTSESQSDYMISGSAGAGGEGHFCLHYSLAVVPDTNLILIIVNQTCRTAAAFCPCSLLDRVCLNCQLVEPTFCECPCECLVPTVPCNGTDKNWKLIPMDQQDAISNTTAVPLCELAPSEAPVAVQYPARSLAHLEPCVSPACTSHMTQVDCLGIVGCVWCAWTNGHSWLPLSTPYCTQLTLCYGGVFGAASPYPQSLLAHLPHSDLTNASGAYGSPVGPVAGGLVALVLVVIVTVYCYRQHVTPPNSSSYVPANLSANQALYRQEPGCDEGDIMGEVESTNLTAATISPYRVNPDYRYPIPPSTEWSDHGYSTMTPHDDGDVGDGARTGVPRTGMGEDGDASGGSDWSRGVPEQHWHTNQTRVSKGPYRIVVPVIVHMVDTL